MLKNNVKNSIWYITVNCERDKFTVSSLIMAMLRFI